MCITSGWEEEGGRDPEALEERVPRMEEVGTTETRQKGSEGKVLNLCLEDCHVMRGEEASLHGVRHH